MELRERFDLCVSISQINRVRAAFGVSNHAKCPEPGKKRREREALSLNRSGKKALLVSCCSLLRSLQRYFLTFKQPFRQVSSLVIHHCVLPTVCLQPCAVSY
jgi:hypothetical protein